MLAIHMEQCRTIKNYIKNAPKDEAQFITYLNSNGELSCIKVYGADIEYSNFHVVIKTEDLMLDPLDILNIGPALF